MIKTIGIALLGVLVLIIASLDAIACVLLPDNSVQRLRALFHKKG